MNINGILSFSEDLGKRIKITELMKFGLIKNISLNDR